MYWISGKWKGWLFNIQKMKIMASSPITSRQIDGETMETGTDFIFLGSKITADDECSHEIKRCFATWKKSYDKPRWYIKQQRHYFANKGPHSQTYVREFSGGPVFKILCFYCREHRVWSLVRELRFLQTTGHSQKKSLSSFHTVKGRKDPTENARDQLSAIPPIFPS